MGTGVIEQPRFMSPRQAAAVLGVSSATLSRRLHDNTIPHLKLGKRILISVEFIDALAASAIGKEA
jgi:excisionase family DNA binding protein